MSSRRMTTIAGSLVTASFSTVMIFSFTASADEGPASSKGERPLTRHRPV